MGQFALGAWEIRWESIRCPALISFVILTVCIANMDGRQKRAPAKS